MHWIAHTPSILPKMILEKLKENLWKNRENTHTLQNVNKRPLSRSNGPGGSSCYIDEIEDLDKKSFKILQS